MLSPVRLPVVCLSVTLVQPTQAVEFFGISTAFVLVRWPSADIQEKFYGDHPRGTPPSGDLNAKLTRVAKYSDIGPIEGYVSETVKDRR